AEVFGAESFAHRFFDVLIDVPIGNVDEVPVAVLILENLFARNFQQAANHLRYLTVFQFSLLLHARLARKIKRNRVSSYAYVPGPQRGHTVAPVLRRVNLTAGTHEAGG